MCLPQGVPCTGFQPVLRVSVFSRRRMFRPRPAKSLASRPGLTSPAAAIVPSGRQSRNACYAPTLERLSRDLRELRSRHPILVPQNPQNLAVSVIRRSHAVQRVGLADFGGSLRGGGGGFGRDELCCLPLVVLPPDDPDEAFDKVSVLPSKKL
jgi:hypothetical protein